MTRLTLYVSSIVILFLLTGYSTPVHATSKLDSLLALLPSSQNLERAKILYEITYELIDVDDEKARIYGREAFKVAMACGDSLQIVDNGRVFASALRRTGSIDSAIVITHFVLPIAQRNKYTENIRSLYNPLGTAYLFLGEYGKALHYYSLALDSYREAGDTTKIVWVLNNIGLVYFKLANSRKAITYYKESVKTAERFGHVPTNQTLVNLALCYANRRNFDSAEVCLERLLDDTTTYISAQVDFVKARMSSLKQNKAVAEEYFLKSFKKMQSISEMRYMADCLNEIASLYSASAPLKAISYLKQAEALLALVPDFRSELRSCYSQYTKAYRQLGNFKLATRYDLKHDSLTEILVGQKVFVQLMEREAEILEREYKGKLDAQKQIIDLKDQTVEKQTMVNALMTVVLVMVGSLLFVINRSRKKTRIINRLLEEKLQERTKELAVTQFSLLRMSNEQKHQFANAIADLVRRLNTIKGLCNVALLTNDEQMSELMAKVSWTVDELDSAIEKLKRVRG